MKRKAKRVTIYKAPKNRTRVIKRTRKTERNYQLPVLSFFLSLVALALLIIGIKSILPFTPSPQKVLSTSDGQQKQSLNSNKKQVNSEKDFCLDIPVLLYHHVQPLSVASLLGHDQLTVDSNIFEEQMKYLADNDYSTISADQLVNALINHQNLPEKSVLITVDDGYDDTYTYVYPIMKKYNLIANIMIPTGLIGKAGYMTWDHLKEMKQSPVINIYNHTHTHAALGNITAEEIEKEIITADADLESNLGIRKNIFAYPYGSFTPQAIEILKEHGFIAAFSTIEGTLHCKSSIMTLQRKHIGNAPLSDYAL